MTEQEFMTSTDPQRMLECLIPALERQRAARGRDAGPVARISDHKTRLFACACLRARNASGYLDLDTFERHIEAGTDPWPYGRPDGVSGDPMQHSGILYLPAGEMAYVVSLSTADNLLEQSSKAALLREIVGNPFRPVTLPVEHRQGCDADPDSPERAYSSCCCKCPWLTPTVLALAQAAYAERPGRKCERCGGSGCHYPLNPIQARGCPDCGGTGRIDDGTLDNDRLAVLADALTDAGCTDATILDHLRSQPAKVACDWCMGKGSVGWKVGGRMGSDRCGKCNGIGTLTVATGPHVRGCWCLDLISGREGP